MQKSQAKEGMILEIIKTSKHGKTNLKLTGDEHLLPVGTKVMLIMNDNTPVLPFYVLTLSSGISNDGRPFEKGTLQWVSHTQVKPA